MQGAESEFPSNPFLRAWVHAADRSLDAGDEAGTGIGHEEQPCIPYGPAGFHAPSRCASGRSVTGKSLELGIAAKLLLGFGG